jgi:glycine/D-amino acid oxidase-like deaminating enzyme
MTSYDCTIVGGGVAGLMTAVRLASHGLHVALLEKNRLGSQASTGNHGMVHSGALYAELHPEIVKMCVESIPLFTSTFSDCMVSSDKAWLFGSNGRIDKFMRLWEQQGLDCRRLKSQEVGQVLGRRRRRDYEVGRTAATATM